MGGIEVCQPNSAIRQPNDLRHRLRARDILADHPLMDGAFVHSDRLGELPDSQGAALVSDPFCERHARYASDNRENYKTIKRANAAKIASTLRPLTKSGCYAMDKNAARANNKKPRSRDIQAEVGRNLLLARLELDKNRTRFAGRYDVHHALWAKWEKGENYPDPAVMVRLCEDHGLTMDYLYRGRLEHMPNEALKLRLARNPAFDLPEIEVPADSSGSQPAYQHDSSGTGFVSRTLSKVGAREP